MPLRNLVKKGDEQRVQI